MVEELVRHGVTHFFAAPGSRSTPLIVAAARNPRAELRMHYDERGTAFQALGYARMAGRAAAWITTSGTAVANGYPAIVEAALEQVPMILLTADRPPELRDTGANQTINQVGIFGSNVVWETDLPVPTADIDPAFVLTTVSHAVLRSAEGPVHLNAMFREPLHPIGTNVAGGPNSASTSNFASNPNSPPVPHHLEAWLASGEPWTRHISAAASAAATATTAATDVAAEPARTLRALLSKAKRPLLVLGRMPVHAATPRSFGDIPVLPDIGSQHRFTGPASGPGPERSFITAYDALLHDKERWPQLAPDLVIQVGRPSVSKRLHTFIAQAEAATIVLDDRRGRLDPDHNTRYRVHIRPDAALDLLTELLPDAPCDPTWAQIWHDLNTAATRWMTTALDPKPASAGQKGSATETLSEQAVVREVIRRLPDSCPLILASSNPIRHANTYADGAATHKAIIANRGASGIDGTLATAAGVATAAGTRASVIMGDLALLHDLNSLALAENLTIVVINNDGGGIFSMLPIARAEDVFEPWFGTPHGRSFRAAAELFDLAWHNPQSMAELTRALNDTALNDARQAARGVLIEVTTNRVETARIQRELLTALQTSLRTDFPLT